MDWELLFKPHILHRGAEYYRDAAVEDLKITDTQITAIAWERKTITLKSI